MIHEGEVLRSAWAGHVVFAVDFGVQSTDEIRFELISSTVLDMLVVPALYLRFGDLEASGSG